MTSCHLVAPNSPISGGATLGVFPTTCKIDGGPPSVREHNSLTRVTVFLALWLPLSWVAGMITNGDGLVEVDMTGLLFLHGYTGIATPQLSR